MAKVFNAAIVEQIKNVIPYSTMEFASNKRKAVDDIRNWLVQKIWSQFIALMWYRFRFGWSGWTPMVWQNLRRNWNNFMESSAMLIYSERYSTDTQSTMPVDLYTGQFVSRSYGNIFSANNTNSQIRNWWTKTIPFRTIRVFWIQNYFHKSSRIFEGKKLLISVPLYQTTNVWQWHQHHGVLNYIFMYLEIIST